MKSKENRLHLESIDVCHVSHHNISLNHLSNVYIQCQEFIIKDIYSSTYLKLHGLI